MFKLITLQDTIRIPPETFGKPLEKVGREQVKQKYEGIVDEEFGYVIAVTGLQVSPIGKIIPGDGATIPQSKLFTVNLLSSNSRSS
jgi:DNA-directed RNA polymerase subunit E'